MKVLVACEFSGVVRNEFRRRGHEAFSCDIRDSDYDPRFHIRDDVRSIIDDGWDLMIAHPPCTHLAVSGARWFKDKQQEQKEALEFVQELLDAPIEKIALENPVSIISTKIRKPDQIVEPYYWGDLYKKKTCLWLKNLPPLEAPEKELHYEEMMKLDKSVREKIWYMSPSKDRGYLRSITPEGMARAMAEQWG